MPVSDVDRAKDFYVTKVGFTADFDEQPNDAIRFVQLTPPGSACSICFGEGLRDVDVQDWSQFLYFADPDGNRWAVQYIPGWDTCRDAGERAG